MESELELSPILILEKLPAVTRTLILRYYQEKDLITLLEELEKGGKDISKVRFQEIFDEFERRRITCIAEFPEWLKVRKTWKRK